MANWLQYIDKTKHKPPRPLLVSALEYVNGKEAALDLGAGALNDSRYLLKFGFKKVTAIDSEENLELVKEIKSKKFNFIKIRIEDYIFTENVFDLVNAQFVLPFVKKEKMDSVILGIKKSLKTGGIFNGQFFGVNDSWCNLLNVTVYSREEVNHFLSNFGVISLKEEETEGQTALNGEKHWHLFNFIVRKK